MKPEFNDLILTIGHLARCVCPKCGIKRANIRLLNEVFNKNKTGKKKSQEMRKV